jgi:Tfp pilus assembly protein PilN
MTALKKQINLLPKDKWEVGVIGKLLKWGLNVGRYVVIFTELIVILSFLYRFSLDRKLTDLNEEMKQKQRTVESYKEFEAQFRRLQEQMKIVKEVEAGSIAADEILNSISLITPIDTSYKSISIRGKEVSLEGQTLSDVGLATLLTKAQNDKKFSEVSLESVSSATDKSQAIEFRMNLVLSQTNQAENK